MNLVLIYMKLFNNVKRNMKKTLKIVTLAAVLLAMPLFASAKLSKPNRVLVTGVVTIDGALAPVGTIVTANLGEQEIKSYTIKEAGDYAITLYSSEVPAGSVLDFEVNGVDATNTDKFVMSDPTETLKIEYNLLSGLVKGDTDVSIIDGDIIQCKNSADPFAVYIVKIVDGKKYIRHIVSLEIFNYYGHLKWENLIQVESLDGYTISPWIRINPLPTNSFWDGQKSVKDRIYEINGDQTKHWVFATPEEFKIIGGDEAAIYTVNAGELSLYREGAQVIWG